MAAKSLQQVASAETLNLRALNPYVATAVFDWQKVQGPKASMSRQFGANAAKQPGSFRVAGASSFGMSGVNAHAMLTVSDSGLLLREEDGVWQRTR